MEKEVVTEAKHPQKEANRITKFLDLSLTGSERFPVDVQRVALKLIPEFNDDPITEVKGGRMGKVDGILAQHDNKKEWAIFYNTDVSHQGRINFTLAHELGHYMLHRHTHTSKRFECGSKDMLDKNSRTVDIETEANAFAANLLMPNHDFREQADNHSFSFDLISHCADRYGVSFTAAVLKWLDFTKKRAIALLSEEGFMHWSKSSDKAFRSGKYFATRKNCIEIPENSQAAEECITQISRNGVRHRPGIWFPDEEVTEHSIYSEEYEKTLTVLILDDIGGYSTPENFDEDAELLMDTCSHFIKNGQTPY